MVVTLLEYTQKSKFLGFNFFFNPNIFVVFVPTNCTIVFQPIDVILQCPLKHAFKMEFNIWTIGVLKQQIESGKDPNVDFKMNNLKPRIYEQLHNAWKKLRSKQIMILKGWETIRLTRVWNNEFQLATMDANKITFLFTVTHDIEKDMEIDKPCTNH